MTHTRRSAIAAALLLLSPFAAGAQDRLKTMPGYDAAQRVAREAPAAITGSVSGITWIDGGRAVEYDRDGKRYRADAERGRAQEVAATTDDTGTARTRRRPSAAASSNRRCRRTAGSRRSTRIATSG